ncbi:Uma2 family endonuclease [Pantanalinema rosaneae CENA516]|uniref:Uma2 family endonuclease n=1 Tax=Pantanalinema rosaneae TaxID=1620701 RepID=UPI003D6EF34B
MAKGPPPSEQRLILDQIKWQKYEAILADSRSQRTARFTYDRGRLEMMHPLDEHERCHKLIESLLLVLADELRLRLEGYKAPTLKRTDLQLGTEPESAYYIQHEPEMRGQSEINLETDPPPDLILEVALSKSAIDKLPIYARLGIPEVWRYLSQPGDNFLKGQLLIYRLQDQGYVESNTGLAFPFLPAGKILQFIDESDALGLMSALRNFRQWVQETTA